MKANICIGLTGPIGSGKSTVSALLADFGAVIIDADQLARQVLEPVADQNSSKISPTLRKIIDTFGEDLLDAQQGLNRAKLDKLIFSDPLAKKKLEEIIHPAIYEAYQEQRNRIINSVHGKIIFYDAALLLQSRFNYPELKLIVVVAADPELCIQRVKARNKITLDEARRRIESQLSVTDQVSKADWVIWNNYPNYELAKINLKVECEKLINHIHEMMKSNEG